MNALRRFRIGPRWPSLLVVAAGVLLVCVTAAANRQNDGLWYQGDSPRHALNGLFWKDLVASGEFSNLKEFAFEYYRQYQAVAPTLWPPVLYWGEAIAYQLFGERAGSAKLVVLLFAVAYTAYLLRFLDLIGISTLGRWFALLGHTQPAFYLWANAVMLDLPALALGMGSLFHIERFRRDTRRSDLVLATLFLVAATLTRPTGAILPLAYLAACMITGHARSFLTREAVAIGAAGAVMVLPWIYVQINWGSSVIAEATTLGHQPLWSAANWMFYARELSENVSWWFVLLAVGGLGIGWSAISTRAVANRLLLAAVFLVAGYSIIRLKEPRYVIGLLPLMTAAIGLGVSHLLRETSQRRVLPVAATVITVFAVLWLSVHPAPEVSGFRDVVEDLLEKYPGQRFVYDGYYDGNVIYYHRVAEGRDRIRLIRGGKVFYATALHKDFGLTEFVQKTDDVRQILERIGCRYVLLEREEVVGVEAARIVRKIMTLDEQNFRFLRTYPVSAGSDHRVTQLDLYEFTGKVSDEPDESLMFPALGVTWP